MNKHAPFLAAIAMINRSVKPPPWTKEELDAQDAAVREKARQMIEAYRAKPYSVIPSAYQETRLPWRNKR